MKALTTMAALLLTLALAACDDRGVMEEAGEALDDAADETVDAFEDARDAVEDAIER